MRFLQDLLDVFEPKINRGANPRFSRKFTACVPKDPVINIKCLSLYVRRYNIGFC